MPVVVSEVTINGFEWMVVHGPTDADYTVSCSLLMSTSLWCFGYDDIPA